MKGRFIVTSHKAIPNEDAAIKCTFQFNYVDKEHKPSPLKATKFINTNADKWFWTDEVVTYFCILK